jgi:thiamine pyrophosphate-dependent acetolactate synthase large subunit-like protein
MRSASCRCVTKRPPPSWPAATPSGPAGSASAWRPPGPGGIHLLNGLYDTKLDGQPVLAITGLQYHDLIGTYTQQDVELDKLFTDACVYNHRIMSPSHVQNVTELACRSALAYRGVSHITMPVDLQSMSVKAAERSPRNVPNHVSHLMAESAHTPTDGGQIRPRHQGHRYPQQLARSDQVGADGFPRQSRIRLHLQPIDFAAVARGFGVAGFTIEDPATCGDILRQALTTPGPVVVDAVVDPHKPPMPPKVSLDQATKFAKSLAKGTPDRLRIALTVASDKIREII